MFVHQISKRAFCKTMGIICFSQRKTENNFIQNYAGRPVLPNYIHVPALPHLEMGHVWIRQLTPFPFHLNSNLIQNFQEDFGSEFNFKLLCLSQPKKKTHTQGKEEVV